MQDQAVIVDLNKLIFTFGPVRATGYAPGEAVKIAPPGKAYESEECSHGVVVVVKKYNTKRTITLNIHQGSAANGQLLAILNASKAAGAKTYPMLIQNLLGQDQFSSPQALIMGEPEIGWSDSPSHRAWEFEAYGGKLEDGIYNLA